MTGQCWWSPTLAMPIDRRMNAAQAEDALLGLTSDDETFRQFEQWAGIKVPLQAPPDSPVRFKERHEWIMKNAKDKFIAFRDWAMSQTHLAFQKAFAAKAPGKDYLAIDFCYNVFSGAAEWPTALDAVRRTGFGPEYVKGVPGFLYCAYMPEANGCTFWEHGSYSWEWMPRIQRFLQDDAYAKALEDSGRTARYIHREFYEQNILLAGAPNAKWLWAPDVLVSGLHLLSTTRRARLSGRLCLPTCTRQPRILLLFLVRQRPAHGPRDGTARNRGRLPQHSPGRIPRKRQEGRRIPPACRKEERLLCRQHERNGRQGGVEARRPRQMA